MKKNQRTIQKPAEAERTATAVLSLLEGALLLSRPYRSIEPMQRAEKAAVVLGTIRKLAIDAGLGQLGDPLILPAR